MVYASLAAPSFYLQLESHGDLEVPTLISLLAWRRYLDTCGLPDNPCHWPELVAPLNNVATSSYTKLHYSKLYLHG